MTFVEQSNTHGITGLWRPRFRWQPPPTLALTKDQHILYWPDSINQSQLAFKQLLRPILWLQRHSSSHLQSEVSELDASNQSGDGFGFKDYDTVKFNTQASS